MQKAVPLLLASLFFIIAVWLTGRAYKELDAWALSTRVNGDIEVFKEQFGSNNHLTWSKGTIVAAEKAASQTPLDADRAMQAGLVWSYVGHMEQGSLDRRQAFKNAINYYELARNLRPAWPHHYRNLHDLYFLTQRSVNDRNAMLMETYKYGKWNRALKLFMVEHTLARPWDRNAEMVENEQQILSFLLNSRDQDSEETVALLKARYPAFVDAATAVRLSK